MHFQALIGLGSNVGDRKAILDGAIAALHAVTGMSLEAVSSYHETQPIGGPPGQGAFLNAVAIVEQTTLGAFEILNALQKIENNFGRERQVRWGERTLDLDLLLLGDEIWCKPELTLPHPRFAYRRFVLAPATEVAPEAVDPISGRTVAELLARIDRRPSLVCIDDLDLADDAKQSALAANLRERLCERLRGIAISGREEGDFTQAIADDTTDLIVDYRRLTDHAKLLSAKHWSQMEDSERWLVADFSLESHWRRAKSAFLRAAATSQGGHDTLAHFTPIQQFAERAVSEALSPTLLVLVTASRNRGVPLSGWSCPAVVISPDRLEHALDEAFTACLATRI